MPLQGSGAISLNDIHIEAGGTTGTLASINDADIRDMISKGAGVAMSFSEWYGASSFTGVTEMLGANSDFDVLPTTQVLGSSFSIGSYPGLGDTANFDYYFSDNEVASGTNDHIKWYMRRAKQNSYTNDLSLDTNTAGKLRIRTNNAYTTTGISQTNQMSAAIPLNRFKPGDYHWTAVGLVPANGGAYSRSLYIYAGDDTFTGSAPRTWNGSSLTLLDSQTFPANSNTQTGDFTVTSSAQNLWLHVQISHDPDSSSGNTGNSRTGFNAFEIKEGFA